MSQRRHDLKVGDRVKMQGTGNLGTVIADREAWLEVKLDFIPEPVQVYHYNAWTSCSRARGFEANTIKGAKQ